MDTAKDAHTKIEIGSVRIGSGERGVVIPEGCDHHRGELSLAKEIAHAAKEAGAKIIKFQLHLPDEEMVEREMIKTSGAMFSKWGSLYGFIKENLLSPESHKELMDYCRKIGIQYFCTPFSLKAAEMLRDMGAEGFKIGSGETEDLPFIEEAAKMGKSMIVSTGMSTWNEVDLTVAAIKKIGTPFALAHCISIYSPTVTIQLNMGVIRDFQDRYGVVVGLSDHTPPEGVKDSSGRRVAQEETIWGAIGAGAKFVEKHFTLDRNAPDADSKFSLDPKALRDLIATVKAAEEAFGHTRDVLEEERPVWIWAKRSVVAARDIKKGTALARDMITSKRPGTGIRSKDYHSIMGRHAVRDIKKGEILNPEDIEGK